MRNWLQGKRGGLLVFLGIAFLVAGGLAWVTQAALRLEEEQWQARIEADLNDKLRLALWRLDSHVFPILAKEASRPYKHYRALYVPPFALIQHGKTWQNYKVYQPSPLIDEELPEWALLHFQVTDANDWSSPQVVTDRDQQALQAIPTLDVQDMLAADKADLLARFRTQLDPPTLLRQVAAQEHQMALSSGTSFTEENRPEPANASQLLDNEARRTQQPSFKQAASNSPDSQLRMAQRAKIDGSINNTLQQEFQTLEPSGAPTTQVHVGPLMPLWVPVGEANKTLLLCRLVRIGNQQLCQGLAVDWPRLEQILLDQVNDLFPDARILPVPDAAPPRPERTMTALPLELDPGPPTAEVGSLGWTPLRIGLALAWAAALVALLTVGLGGWSLLDLSERRIRFVSAVTHELRTPLTTLRLYLDMLTSGMVTQESQRTEYLQTLHSEAERLHRLIGNVLDFSRLENQRTRPEKTKVQVSEIIDQVRTTWVDRCRDAGKELVVENTLPPEATIVTDTGLVQQILANLIDNACKYSRHAEDPHLWLRVRATGGPQSAGAERFSVCFEVEDRGPGVPLRDRRAIFRPFRRGRETDPTTNGVGLGLALALRWARLLDGSLRLRPCQETPGACFCLELPG